MTKNAIRHIAVLTSGGDAPGMNAALRAVVRSALKKQMEVTGIRSGYHGMITEDFLPMENNTVSGIIQRGGTILGSARCEAFRYYEGRKKAFENLQKHKIDALIAIGGDGTFRGATDLVKEFGLPVIGIPGTIDNDLFGTDETIGFDTAMNTAMEAIDKIRDTAEAHERLFLVEVMGRDAGFIALGSGIATGAELILLPEEKSNPDEIINNLRKIFRVHKRSTIMIVAEGSKTGGALKLADILQKDFKEFEMRVAVLGHIQRGGSPTLRDRVLASRLGNAAVEALLEGYTSVMAGLINNSVQLTPMKETWSKRKRINTQLIQLAKTLS